MAAGTLAGPGTAFGPCEGECFHVDCEETRRMAAAECLICGKPIGYDTRFYRRSPHTFVHAVCAEIEIDEEQPCAECGATTEHYLICSQSEK